MTTSRPWPAQLTRATGRQVQYYRKMRELTAEELAKRITDLGLPYTRDQVVNLERKDRRTTITVGEIIALGAVLGVPPALLIMPIGEESELEVIPDRTFDAWNAYLWFTGLGADTLLGDTFPPEVEDVVIRLNVFRRHQNALADYALACSSGDPDDDSTGRMRRLALSSLVAIRNEIRSYAWSTPWLPSDLKAAVEAAEQEPLR